MFSKTAQTYNRAHCFRTGHFAVQAHFAFASASGCFPVHLRAQQHMKIHLEPINGCISQRRGGTYILFILHLSCVGCILFAKVKPRGHLTQFEFGGDILFNSSNDDDTRAPVRRGPLLYAGARGGLGRIGHHQTGLYLLVKLSTI